MLREVRRIQKIQEIRENRNFGEMLTKSIKILP